jgi:hypothetical protein
METVNAVVAEPIGFWSFTSVVIDGISYAHGGFKGYSDEQVASALRGFFTYAYCENDVTRMKTRIEDSPGNLTIETDGSLRVRMYGGDAGVFERTDIRKTDRGLHGAEIARLYSVIGEPERFFSVFVEDLRSTLGVQGRESQLRMLECRAFDVSVLGMMTKTEPPNNIRGERAVRDFLRRVLAAQVQLPAAGTGKP